MSNITIRLPSTRRTQNQYETGTSYLVTPGDVITEDTDYMRGHGTYCTGDADDKLYSSVAGVVERINKLICVRALKSRYTGEVGDIVVGRVKEVQQKRWKIETNSRLDSILQLSSVNLPGGELRRRSATDELNMRSYLNEGDLISAEVPQVNVDGILSLHTRSLRYGKLSQGCLVIVSPSLIKRRKNHIHNLSCGASIILANNGYIWIYTTQHSSQTEEGDGGFIISNESIPIEDREIICRLRNCIKCLAKRSVVLYDTSILYAYEASMSYKVKQLLDDEVCDEIVNKTIYLLQQANVGNSEY
uniref:Exosome complex component RRP4 n=1 Tax=Ciona intestinalis TaxID=7719 RepID=F6Y6W3_CIOIN|nr:exosome complex component RRP4 [Ciona intestinalis]|eukprot:XP_002126379.1 exosome complex component RRP4 [Ciona intestinalis]